MRSQKPAPHKLDKTIPNSHHTIHTRKSTKQYPKTHESYSFTRSHFLSLSTSTKENMASSRKFSSPELPGSSSTTNIKTNHLMSNSHSTARNEFILLAKMVAAQLSIQAALWAMTSLLGKDRAMGLAGVVLVAVAMWSGWECWGWWREERKENRTKIE